MGGDHAVAAIGEARAESRAFGPDMSARDRRFSGRAPAEPSAAEPSAIKRGATEPGAAPADTLDFDQVETEVHKAVAPIAAEERVPLSAAAGWILARDVAAPRPLPGFDHAAVDGYGLPRALIGRANVAAPVLGGALLAGAAPSAHQEGVVRIMTGAPTPAGVVAVIAQERVARQDDAIHLSDPVRAGANIRRRGEDVAVGQRVLPAGTRLDARHVGLLAALGFDAAPVRRRVRVGVVAFGDELAAPGAPLAPGQIYDSNSAMAVGALAHWGVDIAATERVGDDPTRTRAIIARLTRDCDWVITSGGMSCGDADHVRAAVVGCGGCWRALAIRMKPGKPAAFALLGSSVLLGLPGNPFAALAAMIVVGRPILAALEGRRAPSPWRPAQAAFGLSRPPGRAELFPARLSIGGQGDAATPAVERLGKGGSARLAPLAEAEGLGLIAAATGDVAPGDPLGYAPFSALL